MLLNGLLIAVAIAVVLTASTLAGVDRRKRTASRVPIRPARSGDRADEVDTRRG